MGQHILQIRVLLAGKPTYECSSYISEMHEQQRR